MCGMAYAAHPTKFTPAYFRGNFTLLEIGRLLRRLGFAKSPRNDIWAFSPSPPAFVILPLTPGAEYVIARARFARALFAGAPVAISHFLFPGG
jgi:hypothetical protein